MEHFRSKDNEGEDTNLMTQSVIPFITFDDSSPESHESFAALAAQIFRDMLRIMNDKFWNVLLFTSSRSMAFGNVAELQRGFWQADIDQPRPDVQYSILCGQVLSRMGIPDQSSSVLSSLAIPFLEQDCKHQCPCVDCSRNVYSSASVVLT